MKPRHITKIAAGVARKQEAAFEEQRKIAVDEPILARDLSDAAFIARGIAAAISALGEKG